jgi:hypothetical protein
MKIYAPIKYFQGLKTKIEMKTRMQTMFNRLSNATTKPDFTKFETDKNIETKTSSWTAKFHKKYPEAKKTKISVNRIAKIAGIPNKILQEVFKRGLKAYITGHRPGTTQFQWAYARVYSFIMRKNQKNIPHDKDLIAKLK